MPDVKLKYLAALSSFPKFRSLNLRKIRRAFANLEDAFKASTLELVAAGINPQLAQEFTIARTQINPEEIQEILLKEKIELLPFDDSRYPKLLSKIYDPPALLYFRGTLPPAESRCFAVVGTRAITTYGFQITEEFVTPLARAGLIITSGLALGIDAASHRATLQEGGKTIAVLGSGLDRAHIYPWANRYLSDEIIQNGGLVISEYPPGTLPLKGNFPERNRIIAGLSEGTLVIEAKKGSGSLITARFALDEGRDVFAVPGPVTAETSFGPNELIKSGAYLVTSAEDILNVLDIEIAAENHKPKIDGIENQIFSALSREPQHVDDLSRTTKLDIAALTSTLAVMEIKGYVRNVGTMHYVRAN